ncbi:MAG: YtfJ family protein [Smithellaceae bacterium]|jgi:predicted transcriptional regulator
MKKSLAVIFFALLWSASIAWAGELKIGEMAPNFSLQDYSGKVYTLDSQEFQGRVISIFYNDPDKKTWNRHVEDALLKDDGLDRKNNYMSLCITNLKASKLPNMIIRRVIKSRQEKTGSVILLDSDYNIIKAWGLKNYSSDIVVLDKERICRYVYNGKLPPEEVEKLISVIKEYQVK